MAASILTWLEGSVQTITSTGASTGNNVSNSAGTIDCRAAGSTGLIEKFFAEFTLQCQWATVTGITFGTVIADLFLLPAIDGSNYPAVDTSNTPGSGTGIGSNFYVTSFVANVAPTVNTNMLFGSSKVLLLPRLYTVYLTNRSGQTISANWTLKIIADDEQIN